MNNEPVAYACKIVEADFDTNIIKIEMLDKDYKVSAGIKFLCDEYTHPAKTLTDDEVSKYWYNKGHEDGRKLAVVNTLTEARILKVIEKTHFADGYLNANLIKFAEAILKEAGEKS